MDTADRERRLKKIYLDALPGRLDEIRQMMDSVFNGDQSEEALYKLYRLAHNLAGSSATYGFDEIGDKADEMEDWLEGFVAEKNMPVPDDKKQFICFLDDLSRMSEQAQTLHLG